MLLAQPAGVSASKRLRSTALPRGTQRDGACIPRRLTGQRLLGSDGEHRKSQGVKWLNLKNLEPAAQNGLYIGKYAVRSSFGIL